MAKRITKKIKQQVIELNRTIDSFEKIADIVGISISQVRYCLGLRD